MSLAKRNNLMFPSFMDEFFSPDWFGGMEKSSKNMPSVNIKENEKTFELELVAPGRKKEDFKIEIDNDLLTISTENKSEDSVTNEGYTRREYTYTAFERSFSLPETIASDKIKAAYEDGILRFTLPKKEETLPKPKRVLEIG